MQVWTDRGTLDHALEHVNRDSLSEDDEGYQGNIQWNRVPDRATATSYYLTLRVQDSKSPGHRITCHRSHKTGLRRRHTAACWHVYRDFIRALFELDPSARVLTCRADYKDPETFERLFPVTGDQNVGSQADPLCYADACECDGAQVPRLLEAPGFVGYGIATGNSITLELACSVAAEARAKGETPPEWALDLLSEDTARILRKGLNA